MLGLLIIIIIILIIISRKKNQNANPDNIQETTDNQNTDHNNTQETTNNKKYNNTMSYNFTRPRMSIYSSVAKEKCESHYDYSVMPYRKANLFTKTEYHFFLILKQQAQLRGLYVCPKVRLEDIAYVMERRDKQKFRGYVKSRHIDFILIDPQGMTVAGIELDDPSHNSVEVQKIDLFKTEVFKSIGVPLIRIKTGTDYTLQLIIAFDNLNLKAVSSSLPPTVLNNSAVSK